MIRFCVDGLVVENRSSLCGYTNFLGRLEWCGKIVGLTNMLQQFVDIGGKTHGMLVVPYSINNISVQRLLYIVTFYEHPSTNVESI